MMAGKSDPSTRTLHNFKLKMIIGGKCCVTAIEPMLLQGCLPIKFILLYRSILIGFIISSLSLKFTVFSHCWRHTNSFGPNSFFDDIFYVHHLLNYIFWGSNNYFELRYFWTLTCLNIKLFWPRLFIHCNLFLNTFCLMTLMTWTHILSQDINTTFFLWHKFCLNNYFEVKRLEIWSNLFTMYFLTFPLYF